MDGAYKGAHTDPGGFVQKKQTFQYVWEAREGTEGAVALPRPWADGPDARLQGPVRPADRPRGRGDAARPGVLPRLPLVPAAGDRAQPGFSCINGYAYAGNTPTLQAMIGDTVAFHVFAIDNDFHTFHIHGHRWTDPDGTVIDNKTLGPGDSITAAFVEDNPGRWFYHCHVFSHLHEGMNGWYLVN